MSSKADKALRSAEKAAEKAYEKFEERLGLVADSLKLAIELHAELSTGHEGELDEQMDMAHGVVDDLQTAETVEKESDLDLCVKDAWDGLKALEVSLKAKRQWAKDDGLHDLKDALTGALLTLTALARTMKEDLLPTEK